MAQIQAGFNYNTTTNKIVTSDNLNGHVGNAILLPGAISQQAALSGDLELSDNFLALDVSSGSLVKANPQDIFDILPGSLKIHTITGYSNQDIIIQPSPLSTVDTKVDIIGDLAVGSQAYFDNPTSGIPALFFKEGESTLNAKGSLGVTGYIINPTRGDIHYGGVSWLKFGYPYSEAVGDRAGNSFDFQGVETIFRTSASTTNVDHAVSILGTVYINQVQTEELNPEDPNTQPALKVDGAVEIDGTLKVGGFAVQNTKYIPVDVELEEQVASGGSQSPIDIYTATTVVGYRQILIRLPNIILKYVNADNDGTMRTKVDVVAKADEDSVEYVVARWGKTSSGKPFNGASQVIRVPWQTMLSPSDLDLTNKKLTIRIWADNDWGGDTTSIMPSEGFLEITPVAINAETVVPTTYFTQSQLNSDNSTYDGGAPIRFITHNTDHNYYTV